MIKKILVLLIIIGAPIQHYASAEAAPVDMNIYKELPSPDVIVVDHIVICEESYPDHGSEFGECVSGYAPDHAAHTHR